MTDPEHLHEDPRLSELYRRTPRHEPSATSDTLIRAAAHAAVSKPRRQRQVIAGWAVAATLVLSVGIGWQVFQQPVPEELIEPAQRMSAPVTADEAPAAEPAETEMAGQPRSLATGSPQRTPLQTAPRPAAAYSKRLSIEAERDSQETAMQRSLSSPELATQGIAITQQHDGAAGAATAETADCDGLVPEDGATQAQWDAAIAEARRRDDEALLQCLSQQFRMQQGLPEDYPGQE